MKRIDMQSIVSEKKEAAEAAIDDIDLLFNYIDWCKEHGLAYEETKERKNAMQYGWKLHRRGIDLNMNQIMVMIQEVLPRTQSPCIIE